jgi:hypothetical protein
MKLKCDKCKEDATNGSFVNSGGKTFRLCDYCDHFLATHPAITMVDFMGPLCEGKVFENIRKAAKLRKQGKSPWESKPM